MSQSLSPPLVESNEIDKILRNIDKFDSYESDSDEFESNENFTIPIECEYENTIFEKLQQKIQADKKAIYDNRRKIFQITENIKICLAR